MVSSNPLTTLTVKNPSPNPSDTPIPNPSGLAEKLAQPLHERQHIEDGDDQNNQGKNRERDDKPPPAIVGDDPLAEPLDVLLIRTTAPGAKSH
jgi:hypothetical protein